MRILIVHNKYQIPGGEDKVVESETVLLRSYGEEVEVYERDNQEFERMSVVEKISHLWSLPMIRSSYNDLRARIRSFRPDVVHVHNIFYMISPAVYAACRDEGVPVVQTLHNFRLLCVNGLFFRQSHGCELCLDRGSLWWGAVHRCFKNSGIASAAVARMVASHWQRKTWVNGVERYIALSEFSRGKFIRAGIPSEKIVVKGNFLDRTVPTGPLADQGYALFIGRLSPEKGPEILFRAWAGMGALPLKIIGAGPQEEQLKQLAGGLPVEFLGPRTQEECLRYLGQARCLIVPSLCYENCPRVLIEACASGVPVVASRLGSLAEMVIDGKTGLLFSPGDPADLREKVQWLMDHPQQREAMRQAARQKFEQCYNAESHYRFLRDLYSEVTTRFRRKFQRQDEEMGTPED